MLIGKNYKVESDPLNVTIFKRRKAKTAGESWKAIGFFPTPKNALEFLVDLEVSETGMRDFETVCRKQEELHQLIKSLDLSSERLESSLRPEKQLSSVTGHKGKVTV